MVKKLGLIPMGCPSHASPLDLANHWMRSTLIVFYASHALLLANWLYKDKPLLLGG